MLVDVRVHSASTALHWQLGGGLLDSGAAAVPVIEVIHRLSALGSASNHLTVEP